MATNVAKTFLSLIHKHFPKDKKLSKIFNRNTIKVSYSCLPNVKQTISNNNHRLLQLHRMKESTQDSKLCNCRQKSSCPLDGKCLTKCVVYKATVTETTSNNQETYIGLTENEFKTRFNLHKSSISYPCYPLGLDCDTCSQTSMNHDEQFVETTQGNLGKQKVNRGKRKY